MIGLLTIGDELLIGQVVDSNAVWMAQFLDEQGYSIVRKATCQDQDEDILDALDYLLQNVDMVVITGGLGPTRDDRTRFALARWLDCELAQSELAFRDLKAKYDARGRELHPNNLLQTQLPSKARYVENPIGTACGIAGEQMGKLVVAMPGVPREMKAMMQQTVLPLLGAHRPPRPVLHRMLMTATVPESRLAERISDLEDGLPDAISLAYLPSAGAVKLRLTLQDSEQAGAIEELGHWYDQIAERLVEFTYARRDIALQEHILAVMRERKLTLAAAESCTGGYIAHLFTSIAGSSAIFEGGVVSYSNAAKKQVLGVSAEDLQTHGAVSESIVRQMAEGVRHRLGTDFGLATSGIAGPSGGTEAKPVGTVWIALAHPEGTEAWLLRLTKDRLLNIELTATNLLFRLAHLLAT